MQLPIETQSEETFEPYRKIRIVSVPLHSPKDATPQTQEWNVDGMPITELRELLVRQRMKYYRCAKWFKIYKNDEEFPMWDSTKVKGSRM